MNSHFVEPSRRLFAGIAIPKIELAPLVRAVAKLKRTADELEYRLQWTQQSDWHVTLWFFGQVSSSRETDLRGQLAEIAKTQNKSFELDVRGVGAFPEATAARVLWAGVNRSRELNDFYNCGLASWGQDFAPEHDEFVPHITLARFRSLQSATPLIEPFARKRFFSFQAREIVLFESRLQGHYPKYTPIGTFNFV